LLDDYGKARPSWYQKGLAVTSENRIEGLFNTILIQSATKSGYIKYFIKNITDDDTFDFFEDIERKTHLLHPLCNAYEAGLPVSRSPHLDSKWSKPHVRTNLASHWSKTPCAYVIPNFLLKPTKKHKTFSGMLRTAPAVSGSFGEFRGVSGSFFCPGFTS